ncbi:lamin tail domain-containing protein [Candidatus Nomurabacteria bacterium]|nr:lamin tail domain-containing protein [Candidatus Nomurabacteria bacterium]
MHIRRVFFILSLCSIIVGINVVEADFDQPVSHIVISEVSLAGESSTKDEFVELFNPTSQDVNLTGYRLAKYTASKTLEDDSQTLAMLDNLFIPSHGFLLIAHQEYVYRNSSTAEFVAPDIVYGGNVDVSISNNNAIVLQNSTGVIDVVGFGSASTFESSVVSNPSKGKSLERNPGGLLGHGTDTDNNYEDFFVAERSPKNAHSDRIKRSENAKPSVVLAVSQTQVDVGEEVIFDVSQSSDPEGDSLIFSFDFADGEFVSTTTDQLVHSYSIPGEYLVEVRVQDSYENISEQTVLITVIATVVDMPPPLGLKVIINEVLANPHDGVEWVELYNPNSVAVGIDGWTLHDNARTSNLFGAIAPKGFMIVSSTSRLNNSGDKILLKDIENKTVDAMYYGSYTDQGRSSTQHNAIIPGVDEALIRFPDGQDSDNDLNDFLLTSLSTPWQKNELVPIVISESEVSQKDESSIFSPPSFTSSEPKRFAIGSMLISELVSDPTDGEDEFVELYNASNEVIDLSGWFIQDGSTRKTLLEDRKVEPGKYYVLASPRGNLNNGGDLVKLYDKDGQVIDQLAYGDFDDGNIADNAPVAVDPYSLIRKQKGFDTDNDARDFVVTQKVTRERENVFAQVREEEQKTVETKSSEAPSVRQVSADRVVRIHAIFPNPIGDDSTGEYIEIVNLEQTPVDISGWRISDATAKQYIIDVLTLAPSSTHRFERSVTGIALNNSGSEQVKLMLPNGAIVQRLEYAGSVSEGAVFVRQSDGTYVWEGGEAHAREAFEEVEEVESDDDLFADSNAVMGREYVQDGAVGGYLGANILDVVISEIFPNPSGSDEAEFIELYNPTEDDIDMSGVFLDDGALGSRPFVVPVGSILLPGQYMVFPRSVTGLVLNNTADSLRILDQDKNEMLAISYHNSPEGSSYIENGDGQYVWTTTVTPGEENVFTTQKTVATKITQSIVMPQSLSLAQIRDSDTGDLVSFPGYVSVLPGILGSQIFYVQDREAGIQIYMHSKEFPELSYGDFVSINGEVSVVGGQKRIKVKQPENIRVLSKNDQEILSEFVVDRELSQIDETLHARLAQVHGEITELRGSQMYIDDGSEEFLVYFKKGTGITRSMFSLGQNVRVNGIVENTLTGMRILPRSVDDVMVLPAFGEVTKATSAVQEELLVPLKKEKSQVPYGFLAFCVVVGAIVIKVVRSQ